MNECFKYQMMRFPVGAQKSKTNFIKQLRPVFLDWNSSEGGSLPQMNQQLYTHDR